LSYLRPIPAVFVHRQEFDRVTSHSVKAEQAIRFLMLYTS
jgi:hypothetical protein